MNDSWKDHEPSPIELMPQENTDTVKSIKS